MLLKDVKPVKKMTDDDKNDKDEKDKDKEMKQKMRSKKDQVSTITAIQDNHPLAGRLVKDITIENAPTQIINEATVLFTNAIIQLQPFIKDVETAKDQPSRKAARQKFQAKRKEMQGNLNQARIIARKQLNLAEPGTNKSIAKGSLVVSRLALQMFNQKQHFNEGCNKK